MATMLQRLDDIITPIVTDLGLELFDLEFTSSTVRVTIDKAPVDGAPVPIDLSDITAVTRAVSRALDEHDPIPERYSLEVSSPGLERPLRTPRHYERAVGQTVAVKTVASSGHDRRLKGVLVRAGLVGAAPAGDPGADAPDGSVDLELEGGEIRTVAYADIDKARTVFEWGPEPKPTKPKPKAGPTTGSAKQTKKPKKKKVDAT
jgi:ribosome maturation factor RimP